MEVPWTEQQSDHSNLSERSRKELCSVYNDEKPPLHFLDLLRANSRFSVVYGLQCTETLAEISKIFCTASLIKNIIGMGTMELFHEASMCLTPDLI
ncbi:hypothetical protein T07_10851 [Trichinella nelsoni]|uniref:Uncharacterized protein n=1 Tax=Trichinella nelsoni TaxID=6336 RepID=A0A0V0RFY2_9BILA|nr:hypothetical protein T07_10851 [Trichinella nelsoni]